MNYMSQSYQKKRSDEWSVKINAEPRDCSVAMKMFANEDFYTIFWEGVDHGILVLDDKGRILAANPYICDKLDSKEEELAERHAGEVIWGADDIDKTDKMNITSIITNKRIVTKTENDLAKNGKLYVVRCLANKLPHTMDEDVSLMVVHVYFINKGVKLITTDEDAKKKLFPIILKKFDEMGKLYTFLLFLFGAPLTLGVYWLIKMLM